MRLRISFRRAPKAPLDTWHENRRAIASSTAPAAPGETVTNQSIASGCSTVSHQVAQSARRSIAFCSRH
jgi:hypothetical protein